MEEDGKLIESKEKVRKIEENQSNNMENQQGEKLGKPMGKLGKPMGKEGKPTENKDNIWKMKGKPLQTEKQQNPTKNKQIPQ